MPELPEEAVEAVANLASPAETAIAQRDEELRERLCKEIEREEDRRHQHRRGSEPFLASTGTLRGLRLALSIFGEGDDG